MSVATQNERVLAALQKVGFHGITQVDFLAPDVFDGGPPITRVPARIKDLKDQGHSIHYAAQSRDKCRVFRMLDSYYEPDPSTGCWLWRGTMSPLGYGRIGDEFAHRTVWRDHHGSNPPPGTELDHLCRNRRCVNPGHLEVVTHAENLRRGAQSKLTWEDVEHIRASSLPIRELAEKYGVHKTTILRCRSGENWDEASTDNLPAVDVEGGDARSPSSMLAPVTPLSAGQAHVCWATRKCMAAGPLDGPTCPRGAGHRVRTVHYVDPYPAAVEERIAA